MRAPFPALLPIAAAAALVMGAGEAKALTIRYSFTNPSSSYTGGTIEVGSLNQTLATGPLTFTLTNGTQTITINAPFLNANSTELTYSGAIGSNNQWSLQGFNFGGSLTSSTTWGELIGTFPGTSVGGRGQLDYEYPCGTGCAFSFAANAVTFSQVPGPLPALGAAAAFGWSRRLRKRIPNTAQIATRN